MRLSNYTKLTGRRPYQVREDITRGALPLWHVGGRPIVPVHVGEPLRDVMEKIRCRALKLEPGSHTIARFTKRERPPWQAAVPDDPCPFAQEGSSP